VQNVFAKFNGWWVPMIIMFFKNQKSKSRMHWKSPLKDKAHLGPLKYKGTPPTHTQVVWRTVLADSASVQAFIVLWNRLRTQWAW
jgi:hypothetical protein